MSNHIRLEPSEKHPNSAWLKALNKEYADVFQITGGTGGQGYFKFLRRYSVDEIDGFKQPLNTNIYVTIQDMEDEGVRKNHLTSHVNCIFIDIDNANIPEVFHIEPTVICERDDRQGYHIYWTFPEKLPRKSYEDEITQLFKSLIAFYKSDKAVCDLARVMRLPNTFRNSHKDDNRNMYRVVKITKSKPTIDDHQRFFESFNKDVKEFTPVDHIAPLTKKKIRNKITHVVESFKHGEKIESEKVEDTQGRRSLMVKIGYKIGTYGFDKSTGREFLEWASEKFLDPPYSDSELNECMNTLTSGFNYGSNIDEITQAEKDARKAEIVKSLLNPHYFYSEADHAFIDKHTFREFKTEAINMMYSNKAGGINIIDFLKRFEGDLITKVKDIIYQPRKEGQGVVVKKYVENGKEITKSFYNRYKPTNVKPDPEKEYQWFIDHLEYLFDKEEVEYFLKTMAYRVQNPGGKLAHMTLLWSDVHGNGKSFILMIMKHLAGAHNTYTIDSKVSKSDFNEYKANKTEIHYEEINEDGYEFYNNMKQEVTGDEQSVNAKFKAARMQKNYYNITASSNKGRPLRIEQGDRRVFVMRSTSPVKEPSYYKELAKNVFGEGQSQFTETGKLDINRGQLPGLLHYLLEMDISDFNNAVNPPKTWGWEILKDISMSKSEKAVRDLKEDENELLQKDFITAEEFRGIMENAMDNGKIDRDKSTSELRKMGAVKYSKRIRVGEDRYNVWIINNHEKYIVDDYNEGYNRRDLEFYDSEIKQAVKDQYRGSSF